MAVTDPLTRVRVAAADRRRVDMELRAALLVAVESGVSYAALARELGVSRQAVRQLMLRSSL